ncbi:MAG: hypothetical protein GV66_16500 [Phocaeicola dorei]|nr:MAG: hypothetical protein GV66_16500 [Phocaeicola dorei]
MSNLNLENIVGFKAVDKDGNEQNVTVDEMVDMVSTRMVMALSETSTFAAAAATGNDVYENELPTVTDAANVRVLQSSGDAAKMTMQSLASKLGELIGTVTANKDGLMSKNGFLERSKGNTLDFNDYTISGMWVFSDTGFINGPSVYKGGILLVFKTANGNILQICCDYTNSIFIRIHWGEWKSWAQITTVVI